MTAPRIATAVALLAGAPRAAQACAVCLGGQSDLARQAFFGTTLLLTLLPLGLIGGLIWWIRKRARALEAEERRSLEETASAQSARRLAPRSEPKAGEAHLAGSLRSRTKVTS